MAEVNVNDVPVTPVDPQVVAAFDPTVIANVVHNVFTIVNSIATRNNWTQVVSIVTFIDGLVTDPATLSIVLSLLGLVTKVSKDEVKQLLKVAQVALAK